MNFDQKVCINRYLDFILEGQFGETLFASCSSELHKPLRLHHQVSLGNGKHRICRSDDLLQCNSPFPAFSRSAVLSFSMFQLSNCNILECANVFQTSQICPSEGLSCEYFGRAAYKGFYLESSQSCADLGLGKGVVKQCKLDQKQTNKKYQWQKWDFLAHFSLAVSNKNVVSSKIFHLESSQSCAELCLGKGVVKQCKLDF